MMKKSLKLFLFVASLALAGYNGFAQEITINLQPGWNWICYPNATAMGLGAALNDFSPMEGDIIKSMLYNAVYHNGRWRGGLTEFSPGNGYMYFSTRTESVSFVFAHPSSTTVVMDASTDVTDTSAVVGYIVILPEGGHVFQSGVCWDTTPNPDIDDNHTNEGAGIGSFSSTIDGLSPSTTYYVRAYVVTDHGLDYCEELNFTTLEDSSGNNHEYVDLGLPSGLLWATCNNGANTPEDYGDYFAWGETQPKDYYDWSTYQYCNGSENTLTRYCSQSGYGNDGFTDNLTKLLFEDDAATANWGTSWRMPTKEEWEELFNNTIVSWTTQNGVNGQLFTASNGNSIFLPAAGYFVGNGLRGVGSNGIYWSSSLSTDYPDIAWNFYLNSGNYGMSVDGRFVGFTVRAVRTQNNAPTGAINGLFSVSENQQVYFSQGNLQYQGSTNSWKFAENQYDYVGSDNSNIFVTYSGWIDLFGWGTSGYNHGANCYQPWSISVSYNDYNAYGSSNYNLYDQTGQADWGCNSITNGGNQPNQWRTLTNAEWAYVLNTRSTASGIRFAKAKVNNVNGVILLPDDWSMSIYNLSNTNSCEAGFSSNVLTSTQWNALEQAGAVFLPAAGNRGGTSVYNEGGFGFYWSASYRNNAHAYYVYFLDSFLSSQSGNYRANGYSVRVVCNAE